MGNLKPIKKGEVRNPNGKKKGTPNRSTVAKRVLALKGLIPEEIRKELVTRYPGLSKSLTIEEIMTIQQVDKAIMQQDTSAYKAVLDSAYGQPKQEIDNTHEVKELPTWLKKKPTW